jgi:quinol monooxygenase YgiN
MIIVMATVKIQHGRTVEALALSREHVARSRVEPGCLSHAVFEDPSQPDHLFFVEQWESEALLAQHFAVPATAEFVDKLIGLAIGRPKFNLFSATPQPFPRTGAT